MSLRVGKDEYLHSRHTKNKIAAAFFFFFFALHEENSRFSDHCDGTSAHQGRLGPPLVAGTTFVSSALFLCLCFVFCSFIVMAVVWELLKLDTSRLQDEKTGLVIWILDCLS